MSTPRIIIAGTNSGVGKTTVVAALCGAFRKLGLKISVFKCGPDYLDPTYHLRAAGTHSHTLDGWMMGREGMLSTFLDASEGTDIAVIEGVMGLFDGVEPASNAGSTAEIAKWLHAPVLLTIDASGMSRSAAAMAGGFAAFDPDVRLAGVLCNRVGSRNHLDLLRAACTEVPVLGGLPKDAEHQFPQRHLGLRTADRDALPDTLFETWASYAAVWCDLEKILEIARSAPALDTARVPEQQARRPLCRIGIARDDAFHFYYEENLHLLRQAGAELVTFSPIHSPHLPDVDGLYFGGGYPEVHADALAANVALRQDVFAFCDAGKPVYAECGGLMYLCETIRQTNGTSHPMVGWFAADAVMNGWMQALGYAEVVTSRATILGPAQQTFRGHQFRYSTLEWRSAPEYAYELTRRRDGQRTTEGFYKGQVLGSYLHAHWASNPRIAEWFVDACQNMSSSEKISDSAKVTRASIVAIRSFTS